MEAVETRTHTLRVLCSSGDRRFVWRKESDEEVREARRAFREALAQGGTLAYRVDDNGQKSTQIREFDPEAEEIVVVPMVTGG